MFANKNSSCSISQSPSSRQSMPLKIDTSGMADALQKMAEAQMAEQLKTAQSQTINPVSVTAAASARMTELYSRYEKLQEIGRLLNGVPVTDPLPDSLAVDDITITFRTKNADDTYGDSKTAIIKNVICAGDIHKLLSGEMGVLILSLEQEVKSLHELMTKTETQYEKARKQWEANNPDRQIRAIDPTVVESVAEPVPPAADSDSTK